ncbi:hypothetical protein MPER_09366 [Moniliophthora perniciosa FA553]|nr:hypothetical protein MPER_09366 [Moniliophthora perniciosa FA553]
MFILTLVSFTQQTSTIVVIKLSNSGVGWICMNACMIDATLNALVLYWVSSGVSSDSKKQSSLPEIPVTTKATTAVTSTIRFMGPTYSKQTASTASQVYGDPEKGFSSRCRCPRSDSPTSEISLIY